MISFAVQPGVPGPAAKRKAQVIDMTDRYEDETMQAPREPEETPVVPGEEPTLGEPTEKEPEATQPAEREPAAPPQPPYAQPQYRVTPPPQYTPAQYQPRPQYSMPPQAPAQPRYQPPAAPEAPQPRQPFSYPGSYPPAQDAFYQDPYTAQAPLQPEETQLPDDSESSSDVIAPPKPGGKGKNAVIIALVVALIVAIAAIAVGILKPDLIKDLTKSKGDTSTSEKTEPGVSQDEDTSDNSPAGIHYATTDSAQVEQLESVQVAEKVRKSVVGVMVYSNGKLAGEGSGVIWGTDTTGKYYYVVTCAHVISGGNYTYSILTLDEQHLEAQKVAYDTRTDIGVLKVEAKDLPAAELGDSSTLRIGERVYAVGNPGGSEYFGSITDGIISAIDRSISSTYTMTVIQHNAAINPGNSGGALVNAAGQVIGINSSKIADTDYEGMGFAVPMTIVQPVVESLVKNGYVKDRPKLGIKYASVSDYQVYSIIVGINDLPAGSLVIAGINNDSALRSTDAKVGDLIIAVNGKKMETPNVLLDVVDNGKVGDELTLTICRIDSSSRSYDISTFDVTIKLVEDKGDSEQEEQTTESIGGYNYGGYDSFEDYFDRYFGGW